MAGRRRGAVGALVAALVVAVLPATPAAAAAGDLDPSFGGGDGWVDTPFGTQTVDRGRAVEVQPDGKIVVAGTTEVGSGDAARVVRLNEDGSIDDGSAADTTPNDSFGTNGKVSLTWHGGKDEPTALAVQPDGKILVAGQALSVGGLDFALSRLNPDGSLDDGGAADTTPGDKFGQAGTVLTDFDGRDDEAWDLVVQCVGYDEADPPTCTEPRIVVAGAAILVAVAEPVRQIDFALARYLPDGTLDPCFGPPAGALGSYDDFPTTPDGTACSGNGRVLTDFAPLDPDLQGSSQPSLDAGFAAGVQPRFLGDADRLVVAGRALDGDMGLAAYRADGHLDKNFGPRLAGGGRQTFEFTDASTEWARALTIYPDGPYANYIVAAGRVTVDSDPRDFSVVRFTPAGLADGTFGIGGGVRTDFQGGFQDEASGVAVDARDPQRPLVVVGGASGGSTSGTVAPRKGLAVARYTPSGALDPAFGAGGTGKSLPLKSEGSPLPSLALQPDGKPVLASSKPVDYLDFLVVRLLADDTEPPETTIDSGPPPGSTITDPTPTFSFSGSEAGSSFQCKVDSFAWAACTSPYTTKKLANGTHTFSVRAIDPAGNVDPSPASVSFTVELPTVSIGDRSAAEGDSGTKTFKFTVSLPKPSDVSVSVAYATADGTALAPGDYTAKSGKVRFAPGETTKTIKVSVNGDTVGEANETFTVKLSTPTNATIADGQGVGTIVNDD